MLKYWHSMQASKSNEESFHKDYFVYSISKEMCWWSIDKSLFKKIILYDLGFSLQSIHQHEAFSYNYVCTKCPFIHENYAFNSSFHKKILLNCIKLTC